MLTLRAGANAVVLAPEHGGAILGWRNGPTPILRPPGADAALRGDPGAMGCFPLLPYANRIAAGRFTWAGRTHTIRRNFGDHPHAIHGVGWRARWTVDHAAPDRARLGLRHDGDADWPFAFDATLDYTLTETALTVRIGATNRHSAPAPMGIGLHPYFPRKAGQSLRFAADGVWLNDRHALPDRHVAIPDAWNHAQVRAIGSARLDNCFTGWAGTADLGSLTIEADPVFADLQVFTPEGADFFCVEPVSHAPDALNRTHRPMRTLQTDETLAGSVTFRLA